MSYVWTLAEQFDGKLRDVSFELLSRGKKLAEDLDTKLCSVLMGYNISDEDLRELIERGADEVYFIDDPHLEKFQNETYSNALSDLINQYYPHVVLAAATSIGRVVMPYVAIQVDTGLTADCTQLEIHPETGLLLQTRPAIGGNIMATIKTPDHMPQMATVRPKSSRPLDRDPSRDGRIQRIALKDELIDNRVEFQAFRSDDESFVNLEEADVIVAGGKGIKQAANVKILENLAQQLDGVVGASRQVIDRGWLSYPHQIGLSGKTVSANLLITGGISGSIQFLAGIKTCENIVAINADPDANIFDISDFGIIGDLFEIMPLITRKLAQIKK